MAGAFGNYIRCESAQRMGLLPAGVDPERFRFVGNTSLAGAYLALLDVSVIEEIKRLSANIEIVELNLEPDFTSQYVDQLWLPE